MTFEIYFYFLQADKQFLKILLMCLFGLKTFEPWNHITMGNNTGDGLNYSFILLSKNKFLIM